MYIYIYICIYIYIYKLSLHLGKTESILFASNRKLKQHKISKNLM